MAKLTSKDFRELARILGRNKASNKVIDDMASFCQDCNPKFSRYTFYNAVEDAKKEAAIA